MGNYRTEDEFYTHEKFGKVPNGWEVKKLGECFDFFPTSSYSREKLTDSGECLYVHYGDIHTKFHEFIDFQKEELPFVTEDMASRFTKLKDGDLIIADASEDYEGVGKAVEVLNLGETSAISGLHTLHLRAKDDCFVNGFKGYILNNEKVRRNILRSATGIKVYSVSKSGLKGIFLPKPPKPEQQAIASILFKIDEAIKAKRNSIEASLKIKRSLIQQLLTGRLKPDGSWRAEQDFYKDEKFGNIPIGWKYVKLKDVCLGPGEYGANASATDFIPNCPRYIRITDIDDYGNLIEDGKVGIEPEKVRNNLLKENDFLFARTGDTVGKSLLYKENMGLAAYAGYLIKFSFNQDLILPEYFNLIAKSDFFEAFKTAMKRVGAKPNINSREYGSFKFSLPLSLEEQKAIYQTIKPIDCSVLDKQSKIRILERLKKSLMQNLLSGKVRVDVNKINKVLNDKAI